MLSSHEFIFFSSVRIQESDGGGLACTILAVIFAPSPHLVSIVVYICGIGFTRRQHFRMIKLSPPLGQDPRLKNIQNLEVLSMYISMFIYHGLL
jgi:hypothetical protein